MRLHGQRWTYRIGNHLIQVDNAYAWNGWCQERMLVNEDVVQQTSGWLVTHRTYLEPWMIPGGDGVLTVKLVAGFKVVHASATLDGVPISPDLIETATWKGARHDWPDPHLWTARR